MERNDALAGGGTEGRSDFLRFPRWYVGGAATYPQNTESGCRWISRRREGRAEQAGSVRADSKEEGESLVSLNFHCTSAGHGQHTTGTHQNTERAELLTSLLGDNNQALC